jgi:hypothetical protein
MNGTALGVPVEEATASDFMMVRAALVKRLGGANEALVWTRIDYRVSAKTPPLVDGDGVAWWPASRDELADETGLSADQAKRAVQSLLTAGFVISTEHRQGGNYDRTKSYRTVVIGRDSSLGESAQSTGRERPQERAESPTGLGGFAQSSSLTDVLEEEEKTSDALTGIDGDRERQIWRLCSLLADAVRANGHPVGEVGVRWFQACDRLMRIDGYSVDQIEWMIRWSTADEFWAANIRSMPTLRQQFSQLVLQAKRKASKAQHQSPAARANSVVEMGRRLAGAGVAS